MYKEMRKKKFGYFIGLVFIEKCVFEADVHSPAFKFRVCKKMTVSTAKLMFYILKKVINWIPFLKLNSLIFSFKTEPGQKLNQKVHLFFKLLILRLKHYIDIWH